MSPPTLKDIFKLAADVNFLAAEKHLHIATAESCTGGLIGAALTAIAGSSASFKGGIIAYDNTVKVEQLGVSEQDLSSYGAVSQNVAEQMAQGALQRLNVDLAIAVTGIAGPGGGTEEKPVGTVWIAAASKTHSPQSALHNFGDVGRNKVRDLTCYEALKALKSHLINLS
ncbi:nicotinamide-nucleotide amidase [Litorimonas taeanensis]|uniref:Nicotinamide-nucleotide amidase n=1 Tax=Litorimonas taeanensis TaxID=568099 RepID=A0A420WJ81_9PROT|nr:nicotinamide-nucleotide amidohydrolase family protein [Litorimonas taeanensis]RKQ71070.1 nicotinamide-nucleotide amidase [Litorimonas taeanensis]